MAKRKSKTVTVRRSGQRGYALYVPTWLVKSLGLEIGDEYRIEAESRETLTLIREAEHERREE